MRNPKTMTMNKSARLAIGDRVVMVDTQHPSNPEYDVGTVVGFTFNAVRVHWDLADETYPETPNALKRINPAG